MAKEAKRSAKKAKTFETQKLVKKLKALKCVPSKFMLRDHRSDNMLFRKDGTTSGDDQLAQLERQLEALKVRMASSCCVPRAHKMSPNRTWIMSSSVFGLCVQN